MTDFTGTTICTCGRKMENRGGDIGSNISCTFRKCSCGINAVFYTTREKYNLQFKAVHEDQSAYDSETRDKLESLFKLAGIKIEKLWDIKNGYTGGKADWLLVKTPFGMITIGWRKRVIAIDWSDTQIKMIVKDDVTKGEYDCHAWSYAKALDYLEELSHESSLVHNVDARTKRALEEA